MLLEGPSLYRTRLSCFFFWWPFFSRHHWKWKSEEGEGRNAWNPNLKRNDHFSSAIEVSTQFWTTASGPSVWDLTLLKIDGVRFTCVTQLDRVGGTGKEESPLYLVSSGSLKTRTYQFSHVKSTDVVLPPPPPQKKREDKFWRLQQGPGSIWAWIGWAEEMVDKDRLFCRRLDSFHTMRASQDVQERLEEALCFKVI